ncbi:hypothetical protein [Primorskyibacter sp. 2E233]|uniref:hypothetical protein n=1 Tax=Primorskyibacter sp. 2E233 TaxID=3413431 RepID=UPI003BF61BB3
MNDLHDLGFKFECLNKRLSLSREVAKGFNGRYLENGSGFVKDYVKSKSVLGYIINVSGQPHDFALIFHRIPARPSQLESARLSVSRKISFQEHKARDIWKECEVNCVLPIGYFGELSRNVIASGVTLTSAVWLERMDYRPEFWRELRRSAIKDSFCSGCGVGPRAIDGRISCENRAEGNAGGVSSSVEGVLDALNSIKSLLFSRVGDVGCADNLDNNLPALKIFLSDFSQWAIIEERPAVNIKFVDSFIAPSKSFVSWAEIRSIQ